MLQELFNLVKGVAGDAFSGTSLPDDQKNTVVAEATNTVASGLRNMVAGGGLQNLLTMFGGKDNQQGSNGLLSNPLVNMMVGHFAEKLMSKHNLDSQEASSLASGLIPNVLGNLINRTNDPQNQSFSLDNLLNSITGGKAAEVAPQQNGGGWQDILSQLTGGQSGSGGLGDIVAQLAGGAQQQQQRNGGGGLMDLIRGFMK